MRKFEVKLTQAEQEVLVRAWPWPQEAATSATGFRDIVAAVEEIMAARMEEGYRSIIEGPII